MTNQLFATNLPSAFDFYQSSVKREAPIAEFKTRINLAAQVERGNLAQQIRAQSLASKILGESPYLELCISAALDAIKELPDLVSELQSALANPGLRPFQKLGSLCALTYGIAPNDILSDNLPGSYGYLDDWLILSSARWTYLRSPSPAELPRLLQQSGMIWDSLPEGIIPPLRQFILGMEPARATLASYPDAQALAIFDNLLAQPAPSQFTIPPVQGVPIQPGNFGNWNAFERGAIMGSNKAIYVPFPGGGGVGMTSNGTLVGLGI